MFWTLALVFCGSMASGLLSSVFVSRYLVKRALHPEKSEGILKASAPRFLKRSSEKRKPRANTDLLAYQKELQEQGENRG